MHLTSQKYLTWKVNQKWEVSMDSRNLMFPKSSRSIDPWMHTPLLQIGVCFLPHHHLCCLQFSFLIIIFVACYLPPNHHLCWACYSSILICLLCLLPFTRVWYIRYKLLWVMVACNLLHEISYPSSWKTKWSSSIVCFQFFGVSSLIFFCLDRRRRRRRSPRHHLSC